MKNFVLFMAISLAMIMSEAMALYAFFGLGELGSALDFSTIAACEAGALMAVILSEVEADKEF